MKKSKIAFLGLLLAMCVLAFGCAIHSAEQPFPGWRSNSAYHPDKIITDDYENYIQLHKISGVFETLYFEDGTGRHAVELVVMGKYSGHYKYYFLEYNKSNVRTRVRTFSTANNWI
jgi:ABC-type oligopeptide transport system substrate-binding subunit